MGGGEKQQHHQSSGFWSRANAVTLTAMIPSPLGHGPTMEMDHPAHEKPCELDSAYGLYAQHLCFNLGKEGSQTRGR